MESTGEVLKMEKLGGKAIKWSTGDESRPRFGGSPRCPDTQQGRDAAPPQSHQADSP